jgi:hypothetical protein
MHLLTYRYDPNTDEEIQDGRITLTSDGFVCEGQGQYWMDTYPQGLIAGDDDESYLRALAACVSRLTYSGAEVVED